MITKEELETLKEKLLEDKIKLTHELEDPHTDFGSDVDALDEETDEAEEFANKLGIQVVTKEHLRDVNGALERIVVGEYGVCEECHNPISLEVLTAEPESRLCKSCKLK
ncbi:MAG: TraR/DksA family transcriptional regulator [Patescibacteria group bacterium]